MLYRDYFFFSHDYLDLLNATFSGDSISDKPLKDITHLMNEPLKFALIKIDKVRGNACVSRRQIISSNKNYPGIIDIVINEYSNIETTEGEATM